jgi:hypothetical protein
MKVEIKLLLDIADSNVVTKEIQLDRESLSWVKYRELVQEAFTKLIADFRDDISTNVVET